MDDVTDLQFARLGGLLGGIEGKGGNPPAAGRFTPRGKPGPDGNGQPRKGKSKPSWVNDDDTDDTDGGPGNGDGVDRDDDNDGPPSRRRAAKALPASEKPPRGWTAKKPLRSEPTARARRKQTVTSPRGHMAHVSHNSRGTRVSMPTKPAPAGIKAKSIKAAARPTVWGPPSQSVDITRVRTPRTGHNAAVSAAARRQDWGRMAPPGRGSAGGNGVTGGRGRGAVPTPRPRNVRNDGRGSVRHSGEMGEGRNWGRSGSMIEPHKPGHRKSLHDYAPEDIAMAMNVLQKALRGVLADIETGPDFGRAG